MSLEVQLLIDIAIILLAAKILGEIAERAGFSTLLGEVIAGLVLGGLAIIVRNEFMDQIALIGILFMFFLQGLSLNYAGINKEKKMGLSLSLGGIALSFILGFLFGYFVYADVMVGLFVGIAISATSTAASLKSLHGIGELNTTSYKVTSLVSKVDDLVSFLFLTLFTSLLLVGASITGISIAVVIVAVVLVALMAWGAVVIGKSISIFSRFKDEYMLIALILVIVFIVSFAVEMIGIGGAVGAFLVGLAFSRSSITENDILPKMRTIGNGFFIPIFVTYAAALISLQAVAANAFLIVMLLILGIVAKFLGTYVPAWYHAFLRRDTHLISAAMSARGGYLMAVAYIALIGTFIDSVIYSIVIAFMVLTLIVVPLIMRILKR